MAVHFANSAGPCGLFTSAAQNPNNGSSAAPKFWLVNSTASGSSHGSLEILSGAPTTTTTSTKWTITSTVNSGYYAKQAYNSTQPATSFSSTALPVNPPTTSDCWRSSTPLTGTFAAGTWSIAVALNSSATVSFSARVAFRIYHSPDPTGQTGLTEITSGAQFLSTAAWSSGSGTKDTTLTTTSLAAATLNNEYLFFQIALETQTGGVSTNISIVVGSNSYVTAPVFSCAPPTSEGTYAFFARVTTSPTTDAVFAVLEEGGDAGWNITMPGTLQVSFYDKGNATSIAGPTLNVGDWWFFAVTISGTDARFYWKLVGDPTVSYGTATFSSPFTPAGLSLGFDPLGDGFGFTGDMAGFKVWLAPLNAAELDLESQQIAPVRTADLWDWWDLETSLAQIGNTGRSIALNSFTSAGTITQVSGPPIPDVVPSIETRWLATFPKPASGGAMIGSSAAAFACSGTLSGAGAMVGASAAVTVCAATVAGAGALAGTSTAVASALATLLGAGALAGGSVAVTVAAATLAGEGALDGTSTAVTSASASCESSSTFGVSTAACSGSGTLAGAGALAGTSQATCVGSGDLTGVGACAGRSVAVAACAGTLAGAGVLAGASAAVATCAGTLSGAGALAGTSAAVTTCSGTAVNASMIGTSAAVCAASATLVGAGALAGACAAVTSGTGALVTSSTFGRSGAVVSCGGTLEGAGACEGASTVECVSSCTLAGSGALDGASAVVCVASGSFVRGSTAGACVVVTDAGGELAGVGQVLGASEAVTVAAGGLAGVGSLDGAAVCTTEAFGELAGVGQLEGLAAAVTRGSGTIVNVGSYGLSTVVTEALGELLGVAAAGGASVVFFDATGRISSGLPKGPLVLQVRSEPLLGLRVVSAPLFILRVDDQALLRLEVIST